MSELEAKIAAWRKTMSAALPRDTVRELEEHLREQVAALQSEGLGADAAFARAVERVGDVKELVREFERMDRRWLPASKAVLVVLTLTVGLVAISWGLAAVQYHARAVPLLSLTHGLMIWTGYLIVVGMGLVGACALVSSLLRTSSAWERARLQRLLFALTLASSVFVVVGIFTGRLWGGENPMPRSVLKQELGAVLVASTTLLSLVAQRFERRSHKTLAGLAALGIYLTQFFCYGIEARTVMPIVWLCMALYLTQVAIVVLNYRAREIVR